MLCSGGGFMKRSFVLVFVVAALELSAFSQEGPSRKPPAAERSVTAPATTTPMDLAKAAIAAHGGDKFQHMKSLLVMGTVDVTGAFSQVIPATFRFITSGDRHMFGLNTPISPLTQLF